MACSYPRITRCVCGKHKIPLKDTHQVCLHCLGIQHANEAIVEFGKCPHCARMDWSTRINRLTKLQEVMHLESQQQKHEAAQTGLQAAPDTTMLTNVSESKSVTVLSDSHPMAVTPERSSAMPLMCALIHPSSTEVCNNSGNGVAIRQSADSTPSLSCVLPPSRSHKRQRVSKCGSCKRCSRHGCKHGHRQRRSPLRSSSTSCSSSESPCEPRKEKRSRRGLERQHSLLLDVVKLKLEEHQKAMQAQWAMMEARIKALESRDSEGVPVCCPAHVNVGLPSASSQEEETQDWAGSTTDTLMTILTPVVKQEEELSSFSPISNVDFPPEAGIETNSSSPEGMVWKKGVLAAQPLQNLIARAAKSLGIHFPRSSAPHNPPHPTMGVEFEELVKSTWPNPASSEPFREVCSEMYKLNESQAPTYEHMPQVGGFMSSVFQAVQPTENLEIPVPAGQLRITESMIEKMYQTGGMLARSANYLRYLSDYQKRLLEEITENVRAQRFMEVLDELKLIAQYTHQLSSHQAELSGRAMAGSVAIKRQVWMARTNYTDALKSMVADLPFVTNPCAGVCSVGSGPSGPACKEEQYI
ncbi:surfeit locus protein 4 isoform X1 [Denticeps clupeoides]|uniref:surfeit locus protein 4 isoform X1 n=1 Tax=Denticeps clupeoides TaxID=299321 RepID=UPI0010A35789|nr:surfeit locus protein 4 isoform X1 [Denticeps clupeoides]XP_028830431.1 surfeit locus protein 4 isoform X1 [Denticeps clupeoides]